MDPDELVAWLEPEADHVKNGLAYRHRSDPILGDYWIYRPAGGVLCVDGIRYTAEPFGHTHAPMVIVKFDRRAGEYARMRYDDPPSEADIDLWVADPEDERHGIWGGG